ncbi:DUF3459 domain-containing protein [Streptomyces sp. NBC_00846]|uniref:DUF3459 domain-containing protein n=1 Tax=Streptomyces sp. NBC_00846 TaxID=2975849 RepID=UPI003862F6EE
MLTLYREALRLRRTVAGFGDESLTWLPSATGVIASGRGPGPTCVVNLDVEPAELPAHTDVLLAGGSLDEGGRLPQDTAVWLLT